MKGGEFKAENGISEGVVSFLTGALRKGCFDALMVPVRTPGGDSFAWVLTGDEELLKKSSPLPPVMPVQGARALASITRKDEGSMKIGAVMRPCEIRAAIELSKLKQVDLSNVTLISIDCPGAIKLSEYLDDPEKGDDLFKRVLVDWDSESLKPVCRSCEQFSLTAADMHIGTLGAPEGNIWLIPQTPDGVAVLNKLDISAESDIDAWQGKVDEVGKKKKAAKIEARKEIEKTAVGVEALLDTLSACIGCKNCSRVCPICYCRQCFFDSDALKSDSDNYLNRAERMGALRFPPDTLLFHLGRMSHMSLSCVSCGACEDACPMSIPVARIFSFVADSTQELFDYGAGLDRLQSAPLQSYQMDELHQFEKPYVETYKGKVNEGA